MIVYPEELMAQRIKELEAENARLREVLFEAWAGSEGFIPETAQGYVVQPTITIPEGASAITVSADGTVSVQFAGQAAAMTFRRSTRRQDQ